MLKLTGNTLQAICCTLVYGLMLMSVLCVFNAAFANPASPNIKKIPQIYLEEHQGWHDLYYRTFDIAFNKIQRGTPENGFVDFYMDEAFNPNIFQWDTSFIMMFARYGNEELPGIVSLENFYRYQHSDGWIGRELREKDGSYYWPKSGSLEANCSINPPLFSWAEWQSYEVKGDVERFNKIINGKTIFNILVDYYDWIKANRRWENGLYWTTSYANGMDRSPRLGTKHVCEHARGSWVDITAQQALNAYYIAKIAKVISNAKMQHRFEQEHAELAALINKTLWDERDGIYYDLDESGEFYKVKTPASFWPFIARVTSDEQESRMVNEHILNPDRFWAEHHLPTVAKDEKTYMKDGGYWDGAVWAPTTYQTIKGLEVQGYRDEARRIAINHIENIYWVYRKTNTLYENYRPEDVAEGVHARPDFVGWTGVGPIAALIENVMGIQVSGASDSVYWDLALAEKHGITNLQFGDNRIDIEADDRLTPADGAQVRVQTDSPFLLVVNIAGVEYKQSVPIGRHQYRFGEFDSGLSSLSLMHDGMLGVDVGGGDSMARYQTFSVPESQSLAGVDVKIQLHGDAKASPLVAELYAVQHGLPVGEPLAQAMVPLSEMDSFYSVVHIPLQYKRLQAGQAYAVALSQRDEAAKGYFQWLAGVDANDAFVSGRRHTQGWLVDAQAKDAWLKVYMRP